MSSVASSETNSQWNEFDKSYMLKFELPGTDEDLVRQVVTFLEDGGGDDENFPQVFIRMARKYRFAGYIGAITYLNNEVQVLRDELDELKNRTVWWFLCDFFKKMCLKFTYIK